MYGILYTVVIYNLQRSLFIKFFVGWLTDLYPVSRPISYSA